MALSSLEPKDIRDEVIQKLKNQSEFTDYDFEGSAFAVIIDGWVDIIRNVGLYANLGIAERFLDSAIKRSSVVSRAKELNYFPRQRKASSAKLKLTITPDESPEPEIITVPFNTRFNAEVGDDSFTFVTMEDTVLENDGSGTLSGEIDVYEGSYLTYEWTYDVDHPEQRFILEQSGIDDNFLKVEKKESGSGFFENLSEAGEVVGVESGDRVYFKQEIDDNRIEVYFGPSQLGVELSDGDTIRASGLATHGSEANGANVFELVQDVDGYDKGDFTIETVERSNGGAEEESIDSIRVLAPMNWEAQNRAVNVNDFRAILLREYGYIETMNVWGGEENDPPEYGKVLISIKPYYSLNLSTARKSAIEETLEKYKIAGIRTEVIDPEYIFVDVDTKVEFDPDKTVENSGKIRNNIQLQVKDFFDTNVTYFGAILRFSKLVHAIDETDESVLSNLTTLRLKKRFTPKPNVENSWTFNFGNPLKKDSIFSNEFGTDLDTYTINDDGEGNLILSRNDIERKEIGDVDYEKGIMNLTNFAPDINSNDRIYLNADPQDFDIESRFNNLLTEDTVSVTLTQAKI